ncbi:MAG: tetratricopeptide repeat protein [Candidatus Marinimicrobia bacterium]|nr:tetratricopeptide repeat protein [Candidatus Neomarinimicrobiota bacterium]
MKKIFFILLSVLLLLFAAIAVLKYQGVEEETDDATGRFTVTEREGIQQFWQLYRQATEHRIAGELEEAIAGYSQALMLNDEHEDALYYLGNLYWELDRHGEAENAWKRLVQINPASTRGHMRLGDLYLCFESEAYFNIDDAEREYQRALEINSEQTGSLLRLGQLALIKDSLVEARDYFETVLGANDRSVKAQYLGGYIAWKQELPDDAVTMFNLAVQYSLPAHTPQDNLGEGATKSWQPLTVSRGSNCQIFQPYLVSLAELHPPISARQVEHGYQELNTFLEHIRTVARY